MTGEIIDLCEFVKLIDIQTLSKNHLKVEDEGTFTGGLTEELNGEENISFLNCLGDCVVLLLVTICIGWIILMLDGVGDTMEMGST